MRRRTAPIARRRNRRVPAARALALSVALACGVAGAAPAPAPWQQWRSRLDGRQVCAQASPGAGWEWAGGPYRDASCREPLRVIRL
jgi:hypothetical protein